MTDLGRPEDRRRPDRAALVIAACLGIAAIVIFVIGVVIDALIFGTIERRIRRKRGLLVG